MSDSTLAAQDQIDTSRPGGAPPCPPAEPVREVEVAILGGGLCGIAAGLGLQRAGIEDFLIVERADRLGGTWHHNRYPGCAVDIPAHVYSFSFAPNPEWSRVYPGAREIEEYLLGVVRDHDLERHCLMETEIREAAWSEAIQRWEITTSGAPIRARSLVIAAGPLHEAIAPSFPGLEAFTGQAFHSSKWPDDADLDGRRVVAIGTGASAVQYVPAIQPRVGHLTVVQRTPSWVVPKIDWRISAFEKRLLRRFPVLTKLSRYALWAVMDAAFLAIGRSPRLARALGVAGRLNLRRWIKDPAKRRALTPDYAMTCKRLGLSNDFYRALAQPNVDLVASPVVAVREHGVVTEDGTEIPADTIVFGTGFHTLPRHPVNERIRGRDGRTLAEVWNHRPKAYLGTTMSGFPNAFMMFGPNIGTLSGFVMAEAQTDYIVGAVQELRRRNLGSLDVREEAQAAFVAEVDAITSRSTFALGGCQSYYLDDDGRVAMIWPWTMARMRRRLARFDAEQYLATAAVPQTAPR